MWTVVTIAVTWLLALLAGLMLSRHLPNTSGVHVRWGQAGKFLPVSRIAWGACVIGAVIMTIAAVAWHPASAFLDSFLAYLLYSAEFLILMPYAVLTIILTASLLISAALRHPYDSGIWRETYWVPIVQFLCIPATLAIGALGARNRFDPSFPGPEHRGLWATDVLLAISLCFGAYWTWGMKSQRWFAASLALLKLWVLLAAGFIAAMALTGDWI